LGVLVIYIVEQSIGTIRRRLRNPSFVLDRIAYSLHVGHRTPRIWESKIQNSDTETKKIFQKYKNITMSSSFKKKKRKEKKRSVFCSMTSAANRDYYK